jgi:Protein of unknown function (DUF2950)
MSGVRLAHPWSTSMKSPSSRARLFVKTLLSALLPGLLSIAMAADTPAPAAGKPPSAATSTAGPESFDSAEKAADALIDAAEKFNVTSLIRIVGPQGEDLVLTGEYAQDRERAEEFAAQARKKKQVALDPKTDARAYLLVGEEDWPFALPIVKRDGRWSFDAAAGRRELMYRRIGSNELDAIAICENYVDAQFDYAYRKRSGYQAPQYAQHVISTPGKQDGLAWKNPDGSWGGPIGENVAEAIEQGYNLKADPYHGYFFKVLKAQGPAAPLGTMDYVVEGIMIGGFALVAAPAEYGETGLKTFMVSHTGVVYEKDLGPDTLQQFQQMDRFNPDKSWSPVAD